MMILNLFLVSIICYKSDTIYLDSTTGNDQSDCSSDATPCKTLSSAYEKLNSGGTVKVLLQENTTALDAVTNQIKLNKSGSIEPDGTGVINLPVATLSVVEPSALFLVEMSNANDKVSISFFNFQMDTNNVINGHVVYVKVGKLFLNDSTFKPNIQSESNAVNLKHSVARLVGGEARFIRCTFEGLTLRKEESEITEIGGAAVSATSVCNLFSYGSMFIRCSCSNGYGGAIYYGDKNGYMNIRNDDSDSSRYSVFTSCSSYFKDENNNEIGKGGAIFVKAVTQSNHFFLRYVDFTIKEDGSGSSTNIAKYGSNYYIVSDNMSIIVEYLNNYNKISAEHPEESMGSTSYDEYEDIKLSEYSEPSVEEVILYVDDGKEAEDANCGTSDIPCHSIYSAFNKITSEECTILIKSDKVEGGDNFMSIKGKLDITIEPESEGNRKSVNVILTKEGDKSRALFNFYGAGDDTQLEVNSLSFEISDGVLSSLFDVYGGKLTLSNNEFGRSSDAKENTKSSAIKMTGGIVTIDSCEFNNLVLNRYDFTGTAVYGTFESGSLIIKGECSFSRCENEGGNGGAVFVNISKTGQLKIGEGNSDKIYFAGCKTKNNSIINNRGGAIFLNITSEAKNNVMLKNIIFGKLSNGSSEANDAIEGQDLFVESDDIKTTIQNKTFPVIETYKAEDVRGRLVGIDLKDFNTGSPVSLYSILNSDSVDLYVMNGGEGSSCTSDSPCGLLSAALKLVIGNCSVFIKNNYGENADLPSEISQIIIINPTTISPETADFVTLPIMSLTNAGSPPSLFYVKTNTSNKLTFNKFNFVIINSNVLNGNVFYVESGILYCYDCKFTREAIQSTNFKSLLSNDDIIPLSYSAIRLIGGETRFIGCTFEGLTLTKTTNSAEIVEVGGAAISAIFTNNSNKLFLRANTFSYCSCTNGYGGAIYFDGYENGLLNLNRDNSAQYSGMNNVFEYCSCSLENGGGKGGAIFAKVLKRDNNNFIFRYVEFKYLDINGRRMTTNKAEFGNNYYIVSEDLRNIVSYLIQYSDLDNKTPEKDSMGSKSKDEYEDITLYSLCPPNYNGYIYVDNIEGEESDICGTVDLPCRFITSGFGKISNQIFNISIMSGSVNVGSKPVSLYSNYGIKVMPKDYEGSLKVIVENVKDSKGNDGYLFATYGSDSSTLTFERIDFEISDENVPLNYVFYDMGGVLALTLCTFTRPSSDSTPLCESLINVYEDGCLIIDSCTFTNIVLEREDKKTRGGAIVYGSIKDDYFIIIKGQTVFDGCKTTYGHGGALNLITSATLEIGNTGSSEVIFKNCEAGCLESNRNGGGLNVKIYSNASVKFNYITFGSDSNTKEKNDASNGKDLYVNCSNYVDVAKEECFFVVLKYGESNKDRLQGQTFSDNNTIVNLYELLYNNSLDEVFISSSGNDGECDGTENSPCSSLKKAYSLATPTRSSIVNVKEDSEPLCKETEQIILLKNVTFNGKSSGGINLDVGLIGDEESVTSLFKMIYNTTVVINNYNFILLENEGNVINGEVFYVVNGHLTISSCKFLRGNKTGEAILLRNSAIHTRGGSTIVESCTFTGLVIDDFGGAAIYGYLKDNASLTITGSTVFDGCESNSQDGGAIYVTVPVGGRLNIGEGNTDNITFMNCKVSPDDDDDGRRGGAIYLSMKAEGKDSIILDKINFENKSGSTSSSNIAKEGYDLIIEADNLKDAISLDKLKVVEKYKDAESNRIMGRYYGDHYSIPSINLYSLVTNGDSLRIYLKKGGNDNTDCSSNKPCSSLAVGVEKMENDNLSNIYVLDNELDMPNRSITFGKYTYLQHLNTVINEDYVEKVEYVTMKISNNDAITTALFIVNLDGFSKKLRLHGFNFEVSQTSPFSNSLFLVIKGWLYMVNTNFNRGTISSGASLATLSSPLIKNDDNLASINCVFEDFTLSKKEENEEGGAAICSSNETYAIDVKGSIFRRCCCTNGFGGGIYIDGGGNTYIRISYDYKACTFEGCNSDYNNGSGRGGAIFMKVGKAIRFYDTIFAQKDGKTTNSAKYGNDFYLVFNDLEDEVQYLYRYNLLSEFTPISNGMGSFDYFNYEDIPLYYICNPPKLSNEIIVDNSTGKALYCGKEDYKCGSISAAYSQVSTNVNIIVITTLNTSAGSSSLCVYPSLSVSVKPKEDKTENVEVYVSRVVMAADTEIGTEERSAVDFSYADSSSELNMERLSFEISNDNPFTVPMFLVSIGKLGLNKCKFLRQNLPFSSSLSNEEEKITVVSIGASVMFIKGGSVDLRLSLFSYISRDEGNGASIEAKEGEYNLTITNTSFYKCSCENGNGGALYIELCKGSNVIIGKDKGDNTTFENCSARVRSKEKKEINDESSGKGGAIYVYIPTEHGTATFDNVLFKNNEAEEGKDFYSVADTLEIAGDRSFFPFLDDKNKYTNCYLTDGKGGYEELEGNSSKGGNNGGIKAWVIVVIVIVIIVVILIVVGIIVVVVCLEKGNKKDDYNDDEELKKNEEMKEVPVDNPERDDSMIAEDAAISEEL